MSRKRFLDALARKNPASEPAYGPGTSVACRDLMEATGAFFPEAHTDPVKMADLAASGHTILGFDVVAAMFSVCHEAAAMGCNVKWGGPDAMPESGKPIFATAGDIRIPDDLLSRPACRVPLEAIAMLKKRLGDSAAVCGKIFGPWTLGYHLFGVENFLIGTIDDPAGTKEILQRLLPVAIKFGRAQIEAGADCLLLGDHATRDLCSPAAYRDFLMEIHAHLAKEISAPLILHICGNTADRIRYITQTGVACFHWDTKTGPPAQVRQWAGSMVSLMGGISNYDLLRGRPEDIRAQAAAARGHIDIIAPECAIPLATPLANLLAVAV